MLYYSEITNKPYKSVDELKAAEKKVSEAKKAQDALKEKRESRAKEIDAAFAKARKAEKEAYELLNKFCEDYGSYHLTIKRPHQHSLWNNSLWDMFNDIF